MSSDLIAIKVRDLCKSFAMYSSPRDRLKQFILPPLFKIFKIQPKQYFQDFSALKNISFDVARGQTLGIVGRNGAGKSTLLQIICGTVTPTSGSVSTRGRVAALLELGAGFNPEFTGKENIELSATLLGLKKTELLLQFDSIVKFADIGIHINQLVKTYSSGMYVRLAFSIIAHVNADILIIDEALAVGDAFFQQKCIRFLKDFKIRGGTILLVSHDSNAITSLCDAAILLSKDQSLHYGTPTEICSKYIRSIYDERHKTDTKDDTAQIIQRTTSGQQAGLKTEKSIIKDPINYQFSAFNETAESFGIGKIKIISSFFEDDKQHKIQGAYGNQKVSLCIAVNAMENINHCAFGFILKDKFGQNIFAESSDKAFRSSPINLLKDESALIKFNFLMPALATGDYCLNLAIAEGFGDDHILHHWIDDAMVVKCIESRLVNSICGVMELSFEFERSQR